MQLGILGALNTSVLTPCRHISADDAGTLTEGSHVPRQWMYRAMSAPGVAAATPRFVGKLDLPLDDDTTTTVQLLAFDPAQAAFFAPDLAAMMPAVAQGDAVLADLKTRGLAPARFAGVRPDAPFMFEANGRALGIVGAFAIGGGFSADSYMALSDQTFLRLFPKRIPGAPSHLPPKLEPGADPAAVVARIRTLANAAETDRRHQTAERPTGLIHGFGVLLGLLIVHQMLATDVAAHLGEYATFKAMGCRHRFFPGVVFEEAAILAVLGFVPGLAVSLGLYAMLDGMTGLPVATAASESEPPIDVRALNHGSARARPASRRSSTSTSACRAGRSPSSWARGVRQDHGADPDGLPPRGPGKQRPPAGPEDARRPRGRAGRGPPPPRLHLPGPQPPRRPDRAAQRDEGAGGPAGPPRNLSGGQKQRRAIVRALVGNTEVAFADEPTAALAKESGPSVVQLLKRPGRARGTTTVMPPTTTASPTSPTPS